MALNKDLLEILACPKCKADITPTPNEDGLVCGPCGVVYPVKDEIPVMLVDKAVPLGEWTGSKPA
ncbi:MAG: Trm112 family protein [Desulfovibrio sp.]|nr:MAG: Trm112 family protein [Desulfovibrio sp.]